MIPKQQVNMADVARRTGVSIATVSRALRGERGVSDKTRLRIRAAADELAYVVSPEASSLSGGSTGRVAVVVPRINAWYYSSVLAGIENELRAGGLDTLLYCLEVSSQREAFFEQLPLRRKVDAVIVVAFPLTRQERIRLEEIGVSVVIISAHAGHFPSVNIDDQRAAEQAVGHLTRIGHTKIGMIRAVDPEGLAYESDLRRLAGYRAQLAKAGLAEEFVVAPPWGTEGGEHGMELLLSGPDVPTAVFCFSDEVAVGALRTLRRAGIPVPQSMSVIGIDDHPVAELADLTTVRQPVKEKGTAAGRAVIELLGGHPPAERAAVLPTHLVVRGSTAPPTSGTVHQRT
ncbi:LacI family DNA-binding transcriptional regulator [Rhodococcus tibetensis]|uniref:LacI family transcriptional regulator n=1 Tax=Rhodococcus tibetensis TaxID=2965064 RepID=A0ABT1QKI8_9NOCA|nr:LacI family DNA-binding transcriptional regulator [Rhodococcus sp. FXJ9.536]MCQ4122771.1 LacI family transcriptional regulator [Rhodococcus sp. FXJ9.536]